MQRTLVISGAVLGLAMLAPSCMAQSKRKPMTDDAMNRVTAGSVNANTTNGVVNFQGQVPTAKGLVTSTGSLAVQSTPQSSSTSTATLTLNGGAQQNLSSLININAVNSKVNVLLNLNININSTVGTIKQINLNGKH